MTAPRRPATWAHRAPCPLPDLTLAEADALQRLGLYALEVTAGGRGVPDTVRELSERALGKLRAARDRARGIA